MEEFKDIPGTIYEISSLGSVRNKNTKRILKPWNKGKYLAVNLGIGNPYYIHKLMGNIFLTPIDGYDIDHINRNKHDNRFDNLRYVTKSANRSNTSFLKTNKLRQKNISQLKGGSFNVRIFRQSQYVFIKNYQTLEEAIQGRDNYINSNY